MALSWFYNKEITLMQENGHMERGSWIEDPPTPIKTIPCDVQPTSREQIYKEYGYTLDCTKRAFCDLTDGVDVGGLVDYAGQFFDIVKVIQWDDYLDILMKEST